MDRSSRWLGAAVFLTGLVVFPSLASSQPAPSGSPVTPAGATGPMTFVACTGTPTKAASEAAHNAYLAGKASFDEADYDKALFYFRDAFERDCTKNELLQIIARAFELRGDKTEAVRVLEAYAQRAPNDPNLPSVQKRIENLKAQVGGGASSGSQPTGSPPASGAGGAGGAGGPSGTDAATPSAPTPTGVAEPNATDSTVRGGHRAAPYVLAAAGGVLLVGGVILLVVGEGKLSSATTLCPNHVCKTGTDRTTASNDTNSGNTLALVGGVGAGVGALALAGGLVWHFLEKPEPGAGSADNSARPRPRFSLAPAFSPGRIGVTGTF